MNFSISKKKQSSQLLISSCTFEKENIKFYYNNQNIFNLIEPDDKKIYRNNCITNAAVTNTATTSIDFDTTNNNYKPLQPLKYHRIESSEEEDYLPISIKDLRNNDKKILAILSEEAWSTYSFKALGRKLGIHQQSISRALKRLVDLNMIEKTTLGYKIKDKENFSRITILQDNNNQQEDDENKTIAKIKKTKKRFNQLIQIRIPINSNIDAIVNHLVGKWFGNLRWYGLIKKETGVIFQWTASNKYNENDNLFQINLHIVSEYIVIESDAISYKDKIEAITYSNRLVKEIAEVLKNELKQQKYEIPDKCITSNKYSASTVEAHINKVKVKSKENK